MNFPDIKLKFLQNIQQFVSKYNVPPKLLVNWDQTACKYIQCGEWTMDETRSKNVPITGLDDKREIQHSSQVKLMEVFCHPN